MAFWEDWWWTIEEFWDLLRDSLSVLLVALWVRYSGNKNAWPETDSINAYAKTMGFLFMGVRASSKLVVTWTTVVLLGGFASSLDKKDFWSLTAITAVQLPRAFNLLLSESILSFWNPFGVLYAKLRGLFLSRRPFAFKVTAFVFNVVRFLLSVIMSYPILVFFVLGFYVSTGISLWRLTDHYYYDSANGGENLKPAVIALYSLSVAQGMLFGCRGLYDIVWRTGSVCQVKKAYKLDNADLVLDYLKELKAGCEKKLSFADGKNMITYAIHLLQRPNVPERYIWGVITVFSASLGTERQMFLKRELLESDSFSNIIRKLLKMVHPRSLSSRKTRENAARILALLADEIRLEQFPGGIQCISSVLDTCEEYPWIVKECKPQRRALELMDVVSDQGDWLLEIQGRYDIYRRYELDQLKEAKPFHVFLSEYKEFVLQGLCILGKLANDEDNCRIMSNSEGLMSRITAHLTSSRLHQCYHKEWTSIAEESLPLLCKFMVAPGETGAKLRRQISSNDKATIRALQGILECDACTDKKVLLAIAVEILLDLSSLDMSFVMACTRRSRIIILVLLRIFLRGYTLDELKLLQKLYNSTHWMKKRGHIRNLASQELVRLSLKSEVSAMVILRAGGESTPALRDLTNTLVGAKNTTHRIRAAEILEHLCSSYTNDDSYLKSLKEALLNAVPKVLTEIFGYGSAGTSTQAEAEENQPRYSSTDSDLEEGPAFPDNEQSNIRSSHRQNGEEHVGNKLQEALLSLCATVCQKWISTDPDLARRFDEIASKICSEQGKPVAPFTLLVEEAGEILKKKNG